MLNVTTVVLSLALLPAPFAITRIVAGFFVTIVVTYMVARIAAEWDHPQVAMAGTAPETGRLQRMLGVCLRPFDGGWIWQSLEGAIGNADADVQRLVAR